MRRACVVCVALTVAACASSGPKQLETIPAATRPDASADVLRAEELMEAGEFARAATLLETVVAEFPNDARAWFDLGFVAEELRDESRAVNAYRAAVRAGPAFAEAHNNLGVRLRDRGELGEALQVLRRATELDPRFADAHLNLAMTLEDLNRVDAAREAYGRALALAPRDVMIRVNLGFLELEAGNKQRAKELFESARPFATGDASWLTAIGSGLRRTGAFDSSLEALRSAEELQPAAVHRVWSEIALAHYAVGDLDKAEAYLRRALVADRDDLSLQYALGAVLLKKADAGTGVSARAVAREGRRLLRAVIASDPDGPNAKRARRRLQSADGEERSPMRNNS